jgi:benzoyl-CoA 2,3-dioxygenase component B
MGPEGSTNYDVYLRTAVSVDPQGWAQFGHVKMPRLPLGHFPEPGRRQPQDPLRRPQGRKGLAGRARRAPRQPAPHHRDAGRHRAGVGRAAAPPGPDRALHVRPAQPVPDQRGRRPPPVGHGLPAAQVLRPRRPRGSRSAAAAHVRATRTTRASWAPSTRRRPTGWRSSCSRTSPTATASSSCRRWPRVAFDPLARTTKFMLTEEAHHMFVGEAACRASSSAPRR